MDRKNKTFLSLFFALAILSVFLIGSYAFRVTKYSIRFPQVEVGQSKQSVMDLMGQESEKTKCDLAIREKYRDINCSEIYAYYSLLDYWAIAFDEDGKVVKKYNWTFDDGYGKPHDFD